VWLRWRHAGEDRSEHLPAPAARNVQKEGGGKEMRIENKTQKTLIIRFQAPGYDEDIERISPGQVGDQWLHLEDDDIITIEEEGGG